MIKKIDLVNQALSLSGLVSSSNQATPEMVSKGLTALELSMLSLEGKTYVEYIPDENPISPNGNADSGVKPSEAADVYKYISLYICESLAAPFTGDLRMISRRAYRKLLDNTPKESAQGENIPKGQGNMYYGGWGWCSPYLKGDDDGSAAKTEPTE